MNENCFACGREMACIGTNSRDPRVRHAVCLNPYCLAYAAEQTPGGKPATTWAEHPAALEQP